MRVCMPRAIGVAATLVLSTGCKNSSAPKDTALVRFVHAVGNGGPLDFYANKTRDVNGLGFQHATSYFTVDTGQATPFEVTRINNSTALLDTVERVVAAHTYTFMAADSMAGITPLFVADSNTAPNEKAVKLRIIQAAPSFPSVDVYITKVGNLRSPTPTLAGFTFKQVSTYQVVPPGAYHVVMTAPGNQLVVAAIDTLPSLPTGSVRTIVLLDSKKGGLPLSTISINDVTR